MLCAVLQNRFSAACTIHIIVRDNRGKLCTSRICSAAPPHAYQLSGHMGTHCRKQNRAKRSAQRKRAGLIFDAALVSCNARHEAHARRCTPAVGPFQRMTKVGTAPRPSLQAPGHCRCCLLSCGAAEHPGSPSQQRTHPRVRLWTRIIIRNGSPSCRCCLSGGTFILGADCRLRSGGGSWVCTAAAAAAI